VDHEAIRGWLNMGSPFGGLGLYFRHPGSVTEILRCVRGGSTQQYNYALVPVDTLFDPSALSFYDFIGYDQNRAWIVDGTYEVVPPGALPW